MSPDSIRVIHELSILRLDRMRLAMSERPTPENDVQKRVNDVIDDLSARKVSQSDRTRLRKAVDTADAPLTGRAGADAAIGRAIR